MSLHGDALDFRALMKKVEEVVEAIEPADDLDRTVRQMLAEVLDRLRAELGVFGGRVYRREGKSYHLITALPPGREPAGTISIPRSNRAIERLLANRTLYMERDDPDLDRALERKLGVKEFAAVEIGEQAYILAFDVEPARDREEILFTLTILRHVFNQKLRQERMAGVLREARRIQQSILPRSMPRFPPFHFHARAEPMEIVGGDFYDFIPLTADLLGIAVADVSGHGLPAALLVRDVYMGLRMGLSGDLKITRTIERLDNIIHQSAMTSRFVSMFYGELGTNGQFIYVNAGHPPPLYLSASGGLEQLAEGGSVLGPIPDATYNRGFVKLGVGDLMVLYTDGIIEAESDAGEPFGLERLVEVVRRRRKRSSKRLAKVIFEAVESFTGGAPAEDDRTVVVVRHPSDATHS